MQDYVSFLEARRVLERADHAPFLIELKEEYDNELHVTIECACVDDMIIPRDFYGNANVDKILAHCKPIIPDPAQKWEIIFDDYIIYQVRNESYCSFDTKEIRTGKYLIIFKESELLNYLLVSTDAQQLDDGTFYPAPWQHYGIYTQNHIIDVVSQAEPKVFRVSS